MSTTFDADLARANLLRMRAEYKKAEDLCIGILKSNPKSAATHSLLGDVYSDQGLLERAEQWYELSLDLDPSSLLDQHKLEDVREQIKERDHISAITQLGLPDRRPVNPAVMAMATALLLIVAAGLGYAIRYGRLANNHAKVIRTPIEADTENDHVAVLVPEGANKQPMATFAMPVGVDNATSPPPVEDKVLQDRVTARTAIGSQLTDLVQDLKTHITTLSYKLNADDDERAIGADLAKALFEVSPDAKMVSIRAMREDKLVYTADVPRLRYEETLTTDWQSKAASSDAWIPYILTNEQWPKPDTDPPPADGTAGATTDSKPPTGDSKAPTGDSKAPTGDSKPPAGTTGSAEKPGTGN